MKCDAFLDLEAPCSRCKRRQVECIVSMEHIRKDHFTVTPTRQPEADYLLPSQSATIDTLSNGLLNQEQSEGIFQKSTSARIDGAVIDSCFEQ